MSFDVKLITTIPLQLALDCTENANKNSTVELPLTTDDIMDLLNLCLTSTYFQCNGKHYKQLHGTAMVSPVFVVVAEIVMQNIEEQALATYTRTVPLWLRSLTTHSPPYTKTESTIFTNTLTDRTRTYSSPRRSKKMVRYLFQTAWSLATTTN